jgi:hypothetical protein
MKQVTQNFGILALLMGVLLPTPALTQTLTQPRSLQAPVLLAQASDEEKAAAASWNQFNATYQQLATAQDDTQALQIIQALIPLAEQAAASQVPLARWWQTEGPNMAVSQPLASFMDFMIQHQTEKLETLVGWSTLLPEVSAAMQSNDLPKLQQLKGEIQNLSQRMAVHQEKDEALPQIWAAAKAANMAGMAQMVGNFSAVQSAATAERGQAAMCMVSNLPYGSAADVAGNPSAYCNAP